jgi:hypothetical protein
MRKPKISTTKVLERAIDISSLPYLVPRPLAVDFSLLDVRTFFRAERDGKLHPIKRNRQTVSYLRSELLAFLGLTEDGSIASKRPGAVRKANPQFNEEEQLLKTPK